MLILFPNNYFNPSEPDSDYQAEWTAAIELGFVTGLLSNEAIDDERIHLKLPDGYSGMVMYRGWMMRPDLYGKLYNELLKYNVIPMTSPELYAKFHTLPGYYSSIKGNTPKSIWFEDYKCIDWNYVRSVINKCIVKDFVKSEKNTDFPAFLDLLQTNNDELNVLIRKFVEMRGELFTGGIVLKEFVNLKRYKGKMNEWRAFYLNGHLLSLSRNSAQSNDVPSVPDYLLAKYTMAGFYTVDFAELDDGSWTIIECGDGQVSGLPETLSPYEFYSHIYNIFKV
jgi:hypothetical protein